MSANSESTAAGALSLWVDLDSDVAVRMDEITFAAAGLRERQDLQRWITAHPELIGPGLLLITAEFDRWEVRDHKVADRLDVLFLDTSGSPVVAELKRDRASDTVELQALKYAAYCSQLTLDELAEEFAATHDTTTDDAREHLFDHAPALDDGGLRAVKIRLVAGSFGPAVTSVVLWLREYGIDIGCIEVAARRVPESRHAVLSARQLLPLPEAEDYLVRRRRKEQEEDRARDQPTQWSWDDYRARFPAEQVAVARQLFDHLTRYVEDLQLPWTPTLRSWWLGYQRPGGYYVAVIQMRVENPIEFAVKLPDSPEGLGLSNPYPSLKSWWNAGNRQWTWAIPTLADIPDIREAVEFSRQLQPERGPMPRPQQATSPPGEPNAERGPATTSATPQSGAPVST